MLRFLFNQAFFFFFFNFNVKLFFIYVDNFFLPDSTFGSYIGVL